MRISTLRSTSCIKNFILRQKSSRSDGIAKHLVGIDSGDSLRVRHQNSLEHLVACQPPSWFASSIVFKTYYRSCVKVAITIKVK